MLRQDVILCSLSLTALAVVGLLSVLVPCAFAFFDYVV